MDNFYLSSLFFPMPVVLVSMLTDEGKGCVKWAEENNVKVIDVKEMEIINDKRSKEKS